MASRAGTNSAFMAYLLATILTLCSFGSSDSVSPIGGSLHYEGTPVVTLAAGIPTLIYNCAKMPAICYNVDQREHLDDDFLVRNPPLTFHFDTDPQRNKKRRDRACPERWYQDHTCPEVGGQPPVIVAGGYMDDDGDPEPPAFSGVWLSDINNPNPSGAARNLIQDHSRFFAGLFWSCDEWPAAR